MRSCTPSASHARCAHLTPKFIEIGEMWSIRSCCKNRPRRPINQRLGARRTSTEESNKICIPSLDSMNEEKRRQILVDLSFSSNHRIDDFSSDGENLCSSSDGDNFWFVIKSLVLRIPSTPKSERLCHMLLLRRHLLLPSTSSPSEASKHMGGGRKALSLRLGILRRALIPSSLFTGSVGLGCNPSDKEIEKTAVIHYNGNLKP
uniref:Uncharacterized protein n=1 Tax=Lactuca sativa TaxID=4236 RepID=A0A9R1UCX2_LACSA|nr:hypothetical protein LSAT_V11C900483990 [Lactuca sativa]